MRILVPLDGSAHAEYALGLAAQMAHNAPAPTTITLVRVETVVPMMVMPDGMGIPINTVPVTDHENCVTYLMDLTLHPMLAGLHVEWHVASGHAAAAINKLAHVMPVDLIMLTSHGRSGLGRVALGSVAEAVARQSHIPTLVLRLDAASFALRPAHDLFTILIPLDGSLLAEAILPAASLIVRALQGTIVLLHVVTPRAEHKDDEHVTFDDANAYLIGIQQHLTQEGITATYVVAWGEPAAEIYVTATAKACDLIAIATHGRSGVTRIVLGSVAAQLLRQFHRPLLIIIPLH